MNPILNVSNRDSIVQNYQPHQSCCHGFVPPYITEAIKTKTQDPEVRVQLHEHTRHDKLLRKQRKELFFAKATFDNEPSNLEDRIMVYSADHETTLPGRQITDLNGVNDPSIAEIYKYTLATLEFYAKVFGRTSLDSRGMSVIATDHYGVKYNNAFWNGQQFICGDGDGQTFDRFSIDIDVIGHELTHAKTQFDNELEYKGQSGSINESISDIYGSMIRQYVQNETIQQAKWLIGNDVLIGPGALRTFGPEKAYVDHPVLGTDPQPIKMSEYVHTHRDNGGVHENSKIPNIAFKTSCFNLFDIDDRFKNSWSGGGKIWYEAVRRIGHHPDFANLAAATIRVAQEKFGRDDKKVEAFRYAWAAVEVEPSSFGIDKKRCGIL